MKSTARILSSLALAWLVLLGLHWSAWLLQMLFPGSRWVRQLDELPPQSSTAHWPLLLGIGGLLLALALSSRAERLEKLRRERSEA